MGRKSLILLLFIAAKFFLQYIIIGPGYDLHRDEYLYLDQANHPAWGFVSVPPFMSWIAALVKLSGNAVFWVKFFPAIFGVATLVLTWEMVRVLKGNLFACCLAATGILLSSFLRIDMLFQPNSFDILSWTALYYCLLRFITGKDSRWIYLAAVVFAMGFLNKYNIVFLALGLLPAIILGGPAKLFFQKHTLYALGFALLLVLPNLAWQYLHHFPVVGHMKELSARQLDFVRPSDYLKEQVLFFLGVIFLFPLAFISYWLYKPFQPYRLFFWSFIFTTLLYLWLHGKGYYALGLYPVQIAFGAAWFAHLTNRRWGMYIFRPIAILVPALLFIPIFKIAFPYKAPEKLSANKKRYEKFGLLRWEDGEQHNLPQDFADMLGWKELAAKTRVAWQAAGPYSTMVISDNYGQAGAVNYFNSRVGLHALSFNADYNNWFPAPYQPANIIVIKESIASDDEMDPYRKSYASVRLMDSVTNPLARENGTRIYLASGPVDSIWPFFRRRIIASGF